MNVQKMASGHLLFLSDLTHTHVLHTYKHTLREYSIIRTTYNARAFLAAPARPGSFESPGGRRLKKSLSKRHSTDKGSPNEAHPNTGCSMHACMTHM